MKMGAPRTAPKVLDYLADHPNEDLRVATIAKGTGLNEEQVKSAIYNLRRRDGYQHQILVVLTNAVWRYIPTAPRDEQVSAKRYFEELAVTKHGQILIQDTEGVVYLAKEVDG